VRKAISASGGLPAPQVEPSRSDADEPTVRLFRPGAPIRKFNELRRVFPQSQFERLVEDGFRFYHTTFWYPFDRRPANLFESVVDELKPLAGPSSRVVGAEWWFSVLMTNATPQWLLPCHFDRNDLAEKNWTKLKHPEKSSVLFLNAVPYGELVVTDQVLTESGARPKQPNDMLFIQPRRNLYAVFPGHLYHGVIGRMWRPRRSTKLRVTMAVNYWTERPKAEYLRDSRDCMTAFRLAT
jgi:hypothetical protein